MKSGARAGQEIPVAESILFLACLGIALTPLAMRGISCGQDFDFHLQSWMGVVRHWHERVFYPHWFTAANYQAGEPRFVFYPPLSWTLGAILGTLLPWTWTPIAFTVICLLGMGAALYVMAREWMPARSAAFAACAYITNPYIYFVIYERSAFAELLAATFLPLLVLYALRAKPSIPQLALVMCGLWLTDAPAAVMGCYALAVIASVAAIFERRWTMVARAAYGLALGLGLAAFYIVPAAYEQRWVQIANAIMPGMRVQDSFLFEHTGMSYHDQVLRTASWISVALLIATGTAAVLTYRIRRPQPLRKPLLTLAVMIAFLLVPLSNALWNFAPELRYLQFPWRWMLVLGGIFAAFAGIAMSDAASGRRIRIGAAIAALAVAGVLAAHAWGHFWLACDEEDNISAQVMSFHQQGFAGTDEYTPQSADTGKIQQSLPPVRIVSAPNGDEADSSDGENPNWTPESAQIISAKIQIQQWQSEHMTAIVRSPQAGYAILCVIDYPAWRVRVNRARVRRQRRDDGLMTIPIRAGTTMIDVRYANTPDMWAGRMVSLISLTLWLMLAAKSRRRRVMMNQNASRTTA